MAENYRGQQYHGFSKTKRWQLDTITVFTPTVLSQIKSWTIFIIMAESTEQQPSDTEEQIYDIYSDLIRDLWNQLHHHDLAAQARRENTLQPTITTEHGPSTAKSRLSPAEAESKVHAKRHHTLKLQPWDQILQRL